MQLRSAMRILEEDGHLTPATQLLLGAVSKVPLPLLDAVQVFDRKENWLHFPWYSKRSGGGAFVMGVRIYASTVLLRDQNDSPTSFLLLLAHEVGHLPHAARFGSNGSGRATFIVWAMGHYMISYLRHGRHGHRKARIEQEAERGRWVLRNLIASTNSDPLLAVLENEGNMSTWLVRHESTIDRLHRDYPGW